MRQPVVCGHHHRNFTPQGWTSTLPNNRPTWTPPTWIDPTQTPRHNHLHDPPMRT